MELTNEDLDDALNFDLDFDTMAETMGGALPEINLDGLGSLGTRSPSPSESASVTTKGSKRSRADFDTDSECDSSLARDGPTKRMVFQGGFPMNRTGSGLGFEDQLLLPGMDDNDNVMAPNPNVHSTPSNGAQQDRERQGRCPECGLDTHRIVMNENGFELQALTIEGEVLNGRCLLCNPLKEGEQFSDGMQASHMPKLASKKGGRKNGDSPSSRRRAVRKSGIDNNSEPGGGKAKSSHHHSSRGNTPMGSNMGGMSPPPQQRQMMRNTQQSPNAGNNPFPPPGRDSRRTSKFTPTPSQYHSKMALMKQAQLPRKHSAMQHGMLAFGNTNNRAGNNNKNSGKNTSSNRRSSTGSNVGGGNNQMGNKPGPPQANNNNAMWGQQPDVRSSNASLSSVSCLDVDPTSGSMHRDDASQYSQNSGMGGGLGKAMAMGMGMSCNETSSMSAPPPPPQQQRPMSSRSQSPHRGQQPQTPHSQQRRTPSDGGPPLSRSGSSVQTPQSVPVNVSNTMSSRMQAPQSVPVNMSNSMSSRMGTSGIPPSQSMSSTDMSNVLGNVPQAVRLAHSKLQSSIYHHHIYPLSEETERAHVEKTLAYLESGSGDICDIIVAMRRFPFSLPIQRVACEKLYAHCFDKEHAHAIGLVGGIRTIIDAMEHHPEDIALQRGCAGVIKHLASASSYNLDMLDRMGSVAIIVATMERHSKNAPLLESCCWALESMSRSSNSDLKMRVAKGGGIHAAMKAVETFPNNESLLRAAFHCLKQLGYNPSSYNSGQQPLLQGGQQQGGQQQGGHSQQQQRQHGSSSQQKQQHSPGFMSQHRGSSGDTGMSRGGGMGGGDGMSRGGGMMMQNMPNNSMMGNNMMGNNPMRGNGNNGGNRRMG